MKLRLLVISGIVAPALIGVLIYQALRMDRLESELEAVRARPAQAVSPAPPPPAPAPRKYDDTHLIQRIQALEEWATEMTRPRRAAQPAARPDGPPAPGSGTKTPAVVQEVTSLRADVDALLTGAGVEGERGRKLVEQIVAKARETAREERRARFQQFRQEADKVWLDDFSKQAGLTDEQTTGLERILSDRREQQGKLWRSMRDGTLSFTEGRAERQRLRDASDAQVRKLLDPGQYETYQKKRQERRGGHRGGW